MKGIDKRPNKDGSFSYRARVRIKGHPTVIKSFSNMTLAKKWKRDTEVEIERGRYFDKIEAQKHTFGEMIDRHVFTIACNEWAWLTENPVRKVSKPKLPNGRTRFLSEEEIKKVLEACQASKCRDLYIAVVLAMSTAMRYGEIMNLKKTDIDFSLNVITLYETKNGEVRSIPLEDSPLELVKEWVQSLTVKSPLVFPSPHDPKRPKDIRSAWDNAIRKTGIENFRFHDLSHTAASYLAIDGHSLLDIATLLGQKSLQMTKRYAHLSQDYKRRMVSSNNKRLFGEKSVISHT